MLGPLAALAAILAGGRLVYPRLLERRARRRRPLGGDGIIVGAAAIDLPRDGSPAVLMLHGGGDTPQILSGLATHLHARGFAVRAPLLSAHGRSLAEYARASSDRWREEVEREYEALRARHDRVFVVGISMGGALAVPLAAQRPEIPGLVLLAPYLDMPPALRRLARSSRAWGLLFPYLPTVGQRSIHDREAAQRTLGHGLITPSALRALHEVMLRAREALPRVRVPTLVIQSREDNRISVDSAEGAFALLGSGEKRFEWIDGAGHVITVDYGRDRVFELVTHWLSRPTAPAPPGSRQRP